MFHLNVFDAKAFVHIPYILLNDNFSKLAEQERFIGIDQRHSYKVLLKPGRLNMLGNVDVDKTANVLSITCDMTDRYTAFGIPGLESKYISDSDDCQLQVPDADAGEPVLSKTENSEEHNDRCEKGSGLDVDNKSHDNVGDDRGDPLGAPTFDSGLHSYVRHTPGSLPAHYGFDLTIVSHLLKEEGKLYIPFSCGEVVQSQSRSKWIAVMYDKLQSLHHNQVWTLMPLPPGCKEVPVCWNFVLKVIADNSASRCKSQLVGKVYTKQKESISQRPTPWCQSMQLYVSQ